MLGMSLRVFEVVVVKCWLEKLCEVAAACADWDGESDVELPVDLEADFCLVLSASCCSWA